MIENFKIDNIGGSTFGMCLLRNGCRDIFALPSLKYADVTEWPDEDGLEVDYSTLTFNPRTIALTFIYEKRSRTEPFLSKIGDGRPHVFEFIDYDMTVTLRLLSRGGFNLFKEAGTFTLNFVQDEVNPAQENIDIRLDTPIPHQGVSIDGLDFSKLGIIVLDGSIQSLGSAIMPVARQGVTIASRYTSGQTYIPQTTARHRLGDITLQLLIRDKSLSEVMKAHQRLNFYMCSAITDEDSAPNRVIGFDETATEYGYLYKSSSVEFLDKLQSGAFWLRMAVTMTLFVKE